MVRMRGFILGLLALSVPAGAAQEMLVHRVDHVDVSYAGVSREYVEAIAATVQTARQISIEQFGFDIPETIRVTVRGDPRGRVRLFNDGHGRINLTVRSDRDLRKPASSTYTACVTRLAIWRCTGSYAITVG